MNDHQSQPMAHGGALDAAIARFGGTRQGWLDLSTGINPAPPPIPTLSAAAWSRLPEADAERRLTDAARKFYGAPDDAGIVIAPGSQALISLLPFVLPTGVVAVLEPTYSEHARAFEAAGHQVKRFHDPVDIPAEARAVVVVNPNNPDGRRFAPRSLLSLADRLAEQGSWLIVDEAFADTEPTLSLTQYAGRDGLLIYRSFGKFTGLAGLRLGFALTTRDLAKQLTARLGPWAVSTPAIEVGSAIMQDYVVIKTLKKNIAAQSARITAILGRMHVSIVGETALFKTVHHPRARDLHRALCERHILTRAFRDAPTWLRFGNPKDDADGARLEKALQASLAAIEAATGDAPPAPG
ncbi:Aminotransferase, class-I:Aminotransferase, class I and II [Fulvimarina pelagi HTCC2506]|uniref:threonine-phosphate decarboxylase n=1 Tax=Fulvimarina pelagi HTCC2506 TaxID=314231 RepID=Q0G5M9_9HYPH|nr:threonine-phosphate decarboxylase CobD [Fulvimarina pelagi]EAU43035.1 Aminotransferase, class-I:Aminotransferase, class I and II [Fulvimarina pelagi HTCC2506]